MFGSDFPSQGSMSGGHKLVAGSSSAIPLGPLYLAYSPHPGEGEINEHSGETQQGEWVSWPYGHLSMSLGVGMGVGQLGGSSVQATSTKWCASGGVCRRLQDK